MDFIFLLGIAISLAMDAFAISVSNGFIIKQLKLQHALRIALCFGLFQAIMPVIGWAAGIAFSTYIKAFDHWLAFGLLLFIGAKMIYESLKSDPECKTKNCLHFPTLLLLSLATSIDALAVGLSFAFLDMLIIFPVILIGCITFILCLAGIYIGNKVGHFFEKGLGVIGGIILIGLGLKILIEHIITGN